MQCQKADQSLFHYKGVCISLIYYVVFYLELEEPSNKDCKYTHFSS